MLLLSGALIPKAVLSLRTGRTVARVTDTIMNPDNLKLEGFFCVDTYDRSELVLLYQDIRDILPQGFVINDHDVLSPPSDLVRLKQLIGLRYEIRGKQVITISGQHLGKVSDYAVEAETMYIQKLYVTKGLLRGGFSNGSLSIDRSQIHEVTDSKVIIFDPLEKGAIRAAAPA